jgi:hypothetical protein
LNVWSRISFCCSTLIETGFYKESSNNACAKFPV